MDTLTRVLLTSFAFRAILTDLVAVGRDVIGDAAVQVDQVAQVVESVAQTVGTAARNVEVVARPDTVSDTLEPDTKGVGPEPPSKDNLSSTSGTWERISEDVPERLKASVLDRLQEVDCSMRSVVPVLIICTGCASGARGSSLAKSSDHHLEAPPEVRSEAEEYERCLIRYSGTDTYTGHLGRPVFGQCTI